MIKSGKLIKEYVLDFPVLDTEEKDLRRQGWLQKQIKDIKTLTLPMHKFYIYLDEYDNTLHLAGIYDMLLVVYNSLDCFEDFGPSNIIEGFETLKEAVDYILIDLLHFDIEGIYNSINKIGVTKEDIFEVLCKHISSNKNAIIGNKSIYVHDSWQFLFHAWLEDNEINEKDVIGYPIDIYDPIGLYQEYFLHI